MKEVLTPDSSRYWPFVSKPQLSCRICYIRGLSGSHVHHQRQYKTRHRSRRSIILCGLRLQKRLECIECDGKGHFMSLISAFLHQPQLTRLMQTLSIVLHGDRSYCLILSSSLLAKVLAPIWHVFTLWNSDFSILSATESARSTTIPHKRASVCSIRKIQDLLKHT